MKAYVGGPPSVGQVDFSERVVSCPICHGGGGMRVRMSIISMSYDVTDLNGYPSCRGHSLSAQNTLRFEKYHPARTGRLIRCTLHRGRMND